MSPNRKAALAAAEALGGLISWMVGNFFGLAFGKCEAWEGKALYAILAVLAYVLGLTLVTNARTRQARREGYAWGRHDQLEETMKFLTENSKVSVQFVELRPGKPKPTEKAN